MTDLILGLVLLFIIPPIAIMSFLGLILLWIDIFKIARDCFKTLVSKTRP